MPWTRRSTYRPRDVSVKNEKPVSTYWKSYEKTEDTINATCEFNFLGYSESTGSITLS